MSPNDRPITANTQKFNSLLSLIDESEQKAEIDLKTLSSNSSLSSRLSGSFSSLRLEQSNAKSKLTKRNDENDSQVSQSVETYSNDQSSSIHFQNASQQQ